MPKTKKKRKYTKKPDTNFWLSTISYQLERLIICHEKQLGGQVIADFDSESELESKQGDS